MESGARTFRIVAGDAARIAAFEKTGELDVAYSPAGLPRMRVNAFRQRGAISFAFRVIPSRVPNFADLQLPSLFEPVYADQQCHSHSDGI